MLPFVEIDWKSSLRGQIFYNCQKCSHKPGTKQQLCSLPYVVPRSTVFFYTDMICICNDMATFFMFRPKTYFNCHLQHLFGLLSTRRQRQNHAAPPSLTQEYKVNAAWWKPSGCHRENAFLYFFLQMYFCFCLLVFCLFLYGELTLPQPRFLPNGGCGKKQVFGAKASFVCHLPDDGQEIWGKHLITAGSYHLLQFNLRKYEKNISLQLVPYSILKHLVRNIT